MFVPARKTILGLVLAASLLLGVSSAQAANLLLNPGFEALCPGAACHWSPGSGTAIATDIVNPHSESASLAVTRTASTSFYEAVSDCIPVSASTPYNVGYWYRTTTTDLTTLGIIVEDFTDAGCTQSIGQQIGNVVSPVKTGTWTFLKGHVTTHSGAQSATFHMYFNCVPNLCAAGASANFDDAAMQTEPLAVTVASFAARHVTKGVLLGWRTGTEAELLGFQVYRSRGHSWKRLTRSLIVAKGSVSGASYRFLDKTARRGIAYRYRIKALNRDGTTSWFGPVRVT